MTDAVKVKADIMWAYLDKVNDMSGKFQVDLCNLSEWTCVTYQTKQPMRCRTLA